MRYIAILLIVLMLPSVSAIGLVHEKFEDLVFMPGAERKLTFMVRNFNHNIDVDISGELAKYGELSAVREGQSGMKEFDLMIKFPEQIDLEPGIHHIGVKVSEVGEGGGTVGALTSAQKNVKIEIYSKDKKIRPIFKVPDVNEGDKIDFNIDVQSVSYEDIEELSGKITMKDSSGNTLLTLDTKKAPLKSGERKVLEMNFDPVDMKKGSYSAEVDIKYDDKTETLSKDFTIGALGLKIKNYQSNFKANEPSEFKSTVKSIWNNPINNVFAVVEMNGAELFKTAPINLDPQGEGKLTTYWKPDLPPGDYKSVLKVHFGDQVMEKDMEIKIASENEVKESGIDMKTWLIIGLVVLAVLLLFKRRR